MDHKKFHKGVYSVVNRQKYMGKKLPIFRSSWEFAYCRHCDYSHKVAKWATECVIIPYYDPVAQKTRKYFIDFMIVDHDKRVTLIEIKPHRQTRPPVNSKKKSKKTLLTESATFETNKAKWKAAEEFCAKRKFVWG